jgi:outer membrane immunogenic protein
MRAASASILLTALVAVGLAAGPALAAELPVKMPIKAPLKAPEPPPSPVYDWTGFYAGVHGGYSWQRTSGVYDQLDAAGPTDLGAMRLRGAVFGAQVGYNLQMGAFVFGVEADGSWAKAEDTALSPEPAPRGPDPITAQRDYLISVRGRLGWVWDRALIYGTGGIGFTRYDLTITEALPPPVTGTASVNRSGLVWGGGVEYAVSPMVSLRGEFLQYRLGTSFELAAPLFADADFGDFIRLHHINVVRGGLNFRFGGDGPVSSRY